MNKKVMGSSIALGLVLVALCSGFGSGSAQRKPANNSTSPVDVLSYLPASDGIALIDVRRLINETLPRILAGDPAKLAQANAEIDKFKTRTGIDPRSFDRVVLGTRYVYPSPKVTKLETVAIARGTFDAKGLSAAARIAANGKYREEKYRGATILIITIKDQMRLFGVWDMRINELAVFALDSHSLAIGTVASVRAAITAGTAGQKGRAGADLAALATRDPNAVFGFGANVPSELMANLNVGNDTIAKDAGSIRQVYGSFGSNESDVSLMLVARTDSPAAANNLSDTVTGLKQLGGLFLGRMAPARKALAQAALDNLKITTRGPELEIRTQVAAANLASVIK
ncbi:MAG: hypothetical protein QOE96_591 [Blastocatellia bacterium]|nr:hypothetical protein [Blastocatellia bacterium]